MVLMGSVSSARSPMRTSESVWNPPVWATADVHLALTASGSYCDVTEGLQTRSDLTFGPGRGVTDPVRIGLNSACP